MPSRPSLRLRSGTTFLLAALAGIAVAPCGASAQIATLTRATVGVTAGTSGLGVELGTRVAPRVGLRLGVGFLPFDFEVDDEEVQGTVNPPAPISRLTVDFLPRGGPFHLSVGLQHFSRGVAFELMPVDSVELGDRKYSPEEVGRLNGEIWGNRTAPYLGLGWQRTSGRIQPYLDLGAVLTGAPRVDIRVSGMAAGDADLQADLERERRELEDEIASFRAYPHVAVGLRIRPGL
jgi:hypothetical protein